jgi:hypothetical protein
MAKINKKDLADKFAEPRMGIFTCLGIPESKD